MPTLSPAPALHSVHIAYGSTPCMWVPLQHTKKHGTRAGQEKTQPRLRGGNWLAAPHMPLIQHHQLQHRFPCAHTPPSACKPAPHTPGCAHPNKGCGTSSSARAKFITSGHNQSAPMTCPELEMTRAPSPATTRALIITTPSPERSFIARHVTLGFLTPSTLLLRGARTGHEAIGVERPDARWQRALCRADRLQIGLEGGKLFEGRAKASDLGAVWPVDAHPGDACG